MLYYCVLFVVAGVDVFAVFWGVVLLLAVVLFLCCSPCVCRWFVPNKLLKKLRNFVNGLGLFGAAAVPPAAGAGSAVTGPGPRAVWTGVTATLAALETWSVVVLATDDDDDATVVLLATTSWTTGAGLVAGDFDDNAGSLLLTGALVFSIQSNL